MKVYIADCHTGDVVREATRNEIERATHDRERLVEYECGRVDSSRRWGYLVRLETDPQEGTLAIPLDDSEIAALVGGAS